MTGGIETATNPVASLLERHPEFPAVGRTIINNLNRPSFGALSDKERLMPVPIFETETRYLMLKIDPAKVIEQIIRTEQEKPEDIELDREIILEQGRELVLPILACGYKIRCRLKPDCKKQGTLVGELKKLARRIKSIDSVRGAAKLMKDFKKALYQGVEFSVIFSFSQKPVFLERSQPPEQDEVIVSAATR